MSIPLVGKAKFNSCCGHLSTPTVARQQFQIPIGSQLMAVSSCQLHTLLMAGGLCCDKASQQIKDQVKFPDTAYGGVVSGLQMPMVWLVLSQKTQFMKQLWKKDLLGDSYHALLVWIDSSADNDRHLVVQKLLQKLLIISPKGQMLRYFFQETHGHYDDIDNNLNHQLVNVCGKSELT